MYTTLHSRDDIDSICVKKQKKEGSIYKSISRLENYEDH